MALYIIISIFSGVEGGEEFDKCIFGLGEHYCINDFFSCIEETEVKCIAEYIYASKIFKHGLTSFLMFKDRNRMPSLPSSIVIRNLCPNQFIRNRESGEHTPSWAFCPGFMSSPCFFFFDLTKIISIVYTNSI